MAARKATPPPKKAEKQKAIGFVNWKINEHFKSSKGFALYDNDYLTREDKALIALAKKHGGEVSIMAKITVRLVIEKPEIDLDAIEIVTESN